MARFLCPTCQEVVNAGSARFAFCSGCGAPLTIENILPVQLIRAEPDRPDLEAVAEPAG
jgi:predicted amidophosphoribosyltransferase